MTTTLENKSTNKFTSTPASVVDPDFTLSTALVFTYPITKRSTTRQQTTINSKLVFTSYPGIASRNSTINLINVNKPATQTETDPSPASSTESTFGYSEISSTITTTLTTANVTVSAAQNPGATVSDLYEFASATESNNSAFIHG